MGSRHGGEPCARRPRAARLQPHAREGRGVGRASTAAAVADTPARGRRGRRRRDHDGGRRRRRSRRCCSARTAPSPARADGHPVHRLLDDRPRRRAAHRRRRSPSAGHGFVDAPGHRLVPEGRGRHADDHGRRQRRGLRSARCRCSRRWARSIVHVGALGQGQTVKVISNAVSATTAPRSRRRSSSARRAGRRPRGAVEVMGAGSANSTMLELKAQPMLDHDFTPLFKLEHMLKDVGLCLEEARAAGAPFPAAALRARALRAPASAAASPSRTSPPCSRSSRAWPARRSDAVSHAEPVISG